MKNTIRFMMMCVAAVLVSCSTSTAPKHTCTQVSVLRANGSDGVLWLPVQESMGEANIRILADNNQLEFIRVRLAKDSIDYFVPYELSRWGERDLVIEFRTWLPDTVRRDKMVCWEAIRITNDELKITNDDSPYRSLYHQTPAYGWMNDPNGMYYDEASGLWHLYYQHNPYGAMWGNMHWAHSTSRDLLHWEHQPIAIRPTALGTIFSGSCDIDRNNTAGFGENAVVALFTSDGESQKQAIAYSLDGGQTFTHYAGNPVLTDTIADFRDPKVFRDTITNRWVMVLACQQEMRFYASENLKDWTYLSRFGEGYGCHDGVWECPDLIKVQSDKGQGTKESKWVLLVNINPGGPFGGSATQYFVGDWDGKEFKCENSKCENGQKTKWLDYGKDHYATVTWHNAPDNRVVAIGWMSNWQYANQLPTLPFRSQNTIARDLSLYIDDAGEYRVAVKPSPESMALRGEVVNDLPDAAVVELTLDGKQDALITLANDKGEKVVMTLDVHRQTFSMDRTAAGDCSFSPDFAAVTTAPLFVKRDMYHVTLFIDHCSIEAFDGEGAWAMTNLVFPSEPYNRLDVQGGEAKIYNIR
ncbi:MAG: GH32 C-terminal domain-containing protein [Paludibacteraceae bacterium]|nr:GH32 C-terminal domain-containing protein [Paludibacteraceae bacterium]